ncbi:MAG: PGF-CTERM sorting domain-containing protein [Methanobacteriota archaeon]
MKKYIVLITVFAFLLCCAVEPALAQMYGKDQQQMGGREKASDMMKYGNTIRDQQGMHGMGFMHSAGNAYGEYVTFTIDNETGPVLNYGVMGNALFNISITNFNYKSSNSQGSMTWISNTDGSTIVQLHDNPAAVINILTNKSITVIFTLAEDVTATKEDNLIRIESGNVVGFIAGTGIISSSVTGSQVNVATSSNSAVVFRASPVNMPMYNNLHQRFSQEIAGNRIGMEVAIGRNRSYNAINYSERLQLRIQDMNQYRIRLQINATEPAGNTIAINLDNTSLVLRERDILRIHYDGQPIQCVDDPNMVFNATDRPVCWISPIQDRVRAQLMIYIPSYSEHTIDIMVEPEATLTPTLTTTEVPTNTTVKPAETQKTPGFEVLVSLIGLLVWVILARRHNN